MSQAQDYLRQVFAGSPAGGVAWPWAAIKQAMDQVMQDKSDQSADVLTSAALFRGMLTLQPGAALPHALSPEDHLRLLAIQTLGRWDPVKHRDTILRAAALADSDVISHMATMILA